MADDDLASIMPELTKLLRTGVLGKGRSDHERLIAIKRIENKLADVGSDTNDMINHIEQPPPFSREAAQKMFDAGYAKGRENLVEEQKRAAAPKSFFSSNGVNGVNYRIPDFGIGDRDRIGGYDSHNGYSWLDIAEHCAANLSRFPDDHHGFIEDMADQLNCKNISGKQAKYLGRLFYQHLSGRI